MTTPVGGPTTALAISILSMMVVVRVVVGVLSRVVAMVTEEALFSVGALEMDIVQVMGMATVKTLRSTKPGEGCNG